MTVRYTKFFHLHGGSQMSHHAGVGRSRSAQAGDCPDHGGDGAVALRVTGLIVDEPVLVAAGVEHDLLDGLVG